MRKSSFALRDLPLDGQGGLADQIYRAVREAVLTGQVAAGTRLPTSRALAAELGFSRNTVVSAFEALRAEGYVVARVGAGTYVAPQLATRVAAARAATNRLAATRRTVARASPLPAPRLSRLGRALALQAPRRLYDEALAPASLAYDFRPCVPDLERLAYDPWRRAVARSAWSVPPAVFDYADPAGRPELREEIARYLARARGVVCRGSQVVIVGGLAQALDLATRLFVDPGDAVLVEDPHYLGARRVFSVAGARIVGAPVDGEGVDLARVERARLDRCRLAYVTPSHQFPTGSVLSLARRQALLAWAQRTNAYIVEDDYDSEFRYAGRAIPALKSLDAGERVLYVGTFSKTLLPGLRIAYVVLPAALAELFRAAKWLADWSAPGFEQAVLERFLASGDFERHLRRARTCYAESRAALLEAMGEELVREGAVWQDSRAGLHLLVRFPDRAGEGALDWVRAGRARGLGLYPAAPCYLDPTREPLAFVMGFGRLAPDAIRAGVAELARLMRSRAGPAAGGGTSGARRSAAGRRGGGGRGRAGGTMGGR